MLRTLTLRQIAPVAVVLLAVSLTGCGGDKKDGDKGDSKQASSGCSYKSGASSNAVSVDGDFGKKVTADWDKPLKASSLQRTIVTAGKGAIPKKNAVVNVSLSMFNGKDGKSITSATQKVTIGDKTISDSLRAAFECAHLGSRVVTTVPAKDIFGDTGNPQAGVAPGDALVIVTDVLEAVSPPKSTDWADAPAVTFDGRKSPQVTLPGGEPSDDLKVHVIKAGTGAKVASGDTVSVNYKGMTWDDGKVFDETYGKGKAPASYPVNQFVPGFASALIGQRAGAQLIVSIPPKDGYGENGDSPLAGKTMVFVIEIQSTTPAS
jgi:FKBP-type peptidyl-prolyl cis-trans isomerase